MQFRDVATNEPAVVLETFVNVAAVDDAPQRVELRAANVQLTISDRVVNPLRIDMQKRTDAELRGDGG